VGEERERGSQVEVCEWVCMGEFGLDEDKEEETGGSNRTTANGTEKWKRRGVWQSGTCTSTSTSTSTSTMASLLDLRDIVLLFHIDCCSSRPSHLVLTPQPHRQRHRPSLQPFARPILDPHPRSPAMSLLANVLGFSAFGFGARCFQLGLQKRNMFEGG
jgi:hypothetical protein